MLETAAAYLGMSEADLREALQDKTLAEIAKDKGKSVDGLVKALVAAEEKTIDEAAADGRITKAQASEIKSRLAEHTNALVNGELRHGDRPHRRFWPGSGFPRGPPGSIRRPAGLVAGETHGAGAAGPVVVPTTLEEPARAMS